MKERLAILGSGPAGLSAAIYAARAGLKPLVVEGLQPGGQLVQTADVENFPGFENPTSGPALMDAMRRQAERFGARFAMDEATAADFSGPLKKLSLMSGDVLEAEAVIVATGASARWTGAPGEDRFRGRGVSACATCDGSFFKGLDVTVIGGGDTAISDALYLARICRSVRVIHRRNTLRAAKVLCERAFAAPNVSFEWNAVPAAFEGDAKLSAVAISDVSSGAVRRIPCSGAFVAIGHTPNTSIFEGVLELDNGYIRTNGAATSAPGVFAAGDVADPRYKQAVIAAGSGAAAALEAERFLA